MTLYLDDVTAAAQVARAVRTIPPGTGYVLGYFPVARMNPYQALLYSRAQSLGFAPVGLAHHADLDALSVATALDATALLHLHWTAAVLADSLDEEDAATRSSRFISQLEHLCRAGVRLVWTVHNVLPHRCVYPKVESELRGAVAELATAIHVMSRETLADTAPYYRLPEEKIFEVPHPSYLGAYPSHLEKSTVRFELGFEPSNLVIGVVGSIQPYKGISEFSKAVESVVDLDPELRAVVAGMPGTDEESAQLVAELERANHIQLMAARLDPTELATVVKALDAMALPYRASLNSGAALLALSFGVPIVAPLIGHFRELVDRGLGLGYDPDDPDGLLRALGSVRTFLEGFDPNAALEFAQELSGPVISERFFTKLRSMVGLDR